MSDQKILATDFSTGGDGELLSSVDVYGATDFLNPLEIVGSGYDGSVAAAHNRAHFGAGSVGKLEDDAPRQNGNTFGQGTNTANQYASLVVGITGAATPGVIVRGNTDATAYMYYRHNADTARRIGRWTAAGSITVLATVTGVGDLNPGDTLKLTANGISLVGRHNGTFDTGISDATLTHGHTGVYSFGEHGGAVGTSFEAGRVSSKDQRDPERSNLNTIQIQRLMRRPRVVVVAQR